MTSDDNGIPLEGATEENNLGQAKRVLNEALTGYSTRSKKFLINEALNYIEKEIRK